MIRIEQKITTYNLSIEKIKKKNTSNQFDRKFFNNSTKRSEIRLCEPIAVCN